MKQAGGPVLVFWKSAGKDRPATRFATAEGIV